MIHLFKKVYITSDFFIDVKQHRLVISETRGFPIDHSLQQYGHVLNSVLSLDDLVGPEKQFETLKDVFVSINDFVTNNTNSKFIIYADEQNLSTILYAWYKELLPNATQETIYSIIKSAIFRLNVFHVNFFESTTSFSFENKKINFVEPQIEISLGGELPPEIKTTVSVEFLLASYLYNGSYKNELKKSLIPLIKKDLEKYLFEIKEILFVHLLTPGFNSQLELPVQPSLSNIENVTEWTESKYIEVFTTPRIWNMKFLSLPSSSKQNIKLDQLTNDDIQTIKDFTTICGNTWEEESVYHFIKSDVNKLDFINAIDINTFTDELLDQIIDVESTFQHAAGSFFSIDLSSVNHYLVTTILLYNKENNVDKLAEFALS